VDERDDQEQGPLTPSPGDARGRRVPWLRLVSVRSDSAVADAAVYPDEPRATTLRPVSAPTTPRVAALDALLKDVDELRASVRRDLGLAATAVEAGEEELAAYLLSGTDDDLRAFGERAVVRVDELPAAEAGPGAGAARAAGAEELSDALVDVVGPARRRRMAPAAPLVAAAALLFASLSGSLPELGGGERVSSEAAVRSFGDLAALADSGASPQVVSEAAAQLHADMAPLIAAASTDPEAAEEAIAILQRETEVLSQSLDETHPELRQVIEQARALVRYLKAASKKPAVKVPAVVAPPQRPATAESTKPSPRPSAKPSATSSPKPASTPSPKPSSTATPAPSASPSGSPEPDPLNPGLG
jgi:hypothetical protein